MQLNLAHVAEYAAITPSENVIQNKLQLAVAGRGEKTIPSGSGRCKFGSADVWASVVKTLSRYTQLGRNGVYTSRPEAANPKGILAAPSKFSATRESHGVIISADLF